MIRTILLSISLLGMVLAGNAQSAQAPQPTQVPQSTQSILHPQSDQFTQATQSLREPQSPQPPAKRPLRPSDLYRLPAVSDPQPSPDGKWVSYTVTTIDSLKDSRNSDIWMISRDGSQDIQLTNSPDGESRARWSPDGRYLSFLSSRQQSGASARPEPKGSQVWLMDRRGGEGKRLTEIKGGVDDYAWSPDSKKLLLTLTDPDPEDTGKVKTTKPYVIDRYQYKQDVTGYRYKKTHTHLYLFDIDAKKLDTLTRGTHDEGSAVWSPDGSAVAFVSNRTADPDRNENTDIFVIDARPGAEMRAITDWKGTDNAPWWSPDGSRIAYTRSVSEEDYHMYDEPVLCVVSKDGGAPTILSRSLDRPVFDPRWSKDGQTVIALVADDRQQYVAAFSIPDGKMTKLADGQRVFTTIQAAGTDWVTISSDPQTPAEVYVLENGVPRRLTRHTDAFLAPLSLATVEGFESKGADGTTVSGILYHPVIAAPNPAHQPSRSTSQRQVDRATSTSPRQGDQEHPTFPRQGEQTSSTSTGAGDNREPAAAKLPMILFIHGGPVGQDAFDFDLARQMLAGGGYLVAGVNYRGSNGRGLAFSKVISGDWGNKEVIDLHGAVDYLVKKGLADPNRLGVAGWSYGAILTDYLIASDTRFKAASAGAGTGFTLALYGVDQYISQYNNEIGVPWKNIDRYLKISYPFLKADRIKTPTLFMSGEKDFNVPTAGSEQMYQALRTLGVPTELIVYPGQFHGISIPSYQRDRYDRWLAWFDKYLQ